MGDRMKRRLVPAVVAAVVLIAALAPSASAAGPARFGRVDLANSKITLGDLPGHSNPAQLVDIAVEVAGQPVSAYVGAALDNGANLSEVQRTGIRQTLVQRQSVVSTKLQAMGFTIESRFTDVFNGFRLRVPAGKIPTIARLAGVTHIYSVPIETRDNANTDNFLGVPTTWGATGFTGAGVKIAIIDTGINYDHLDFNGPGAAAFAANDGVTIGPGIFPTARVQKGWDFVGDSYDAESTNPADQIPQPDPNPLDCKDPAADQHGTHTSGTAAGNGVLSNGSVYLGPYNAATLTSHSFRVAPGVAPQATIYAYRVFGCFGSTNIVADAIERAVQDGADVISMSLGSPFGNPGSLDAIASNNAAMAGVTVVASSGNQGPSAYETGAPGVGTRVISVGALDAQPGFPGATVQFTSGTANGINANGATTLPVTGVINRFADDPSTPGDPDTGVGFENLGCDPTAYTYNGFVAGQIAVVDRGICDRIQKAQVGQTQGAAAVVMVNNSAGFPPFENTIPGVTIPFIGVSNADAPAFATNNGTSATIVSAGLIANPAYRHSATFTSAGPRRVDDMIKPDVVAPGVSVFSADGSTVDQGKALSGTSMAAPATAGVAALVKQAHMTWTARQIKAAIMGTASGDQVVPYDVRLSGAGVPQPILAVRTKAYVYTDPGSSSLTFGYNQAQNLPATTIAYQDTRAFTINNTSSAPITYLLANAFNSPDEGLVVKISPSTVTVAANSFRYVNVTLTLSKAAAALLPSVAPNHAPLLAVDDFGQLYSPLGYIAGVITATPSAVKTGVVPLRIPWLVATRGVSQLIALGGTKPPYAKSGTKATSSIVVKNYGVHSGIADLYQWGLQDAAEGLAGIDMRAAGVQSLPSDVCDSSASPSDRCLVFAVNTWGRWSSASENEFDVNVDINGDGIADYSVVGLDFGWLTSSGPSGIEYSLIFDAHTGDLLNGYFATAPSDSSTLLLPVLASDLGLSSTGTKKFDYWAESFNVADNDAQLFQFDLMTTGIDPSVGSQLAKFNAFNPALSTGDFVPLSPGQKAKIPLKVDLNQFSAGKYGQLGWLVVTLEDPNGAAQADMVPVGSVPHK